MSYLFLLLLSTHFVHTINSKVRIQDPISEIKPVRTESIRNSINQRLSEGRWTKHSGREASSGARKRDANLVNASPLHEEASVVEERGDDRSVTDQCTYTFVVPSSNAQCHGRSTALLDSEKRVLQMHVEVLNAKTSIDEIRREIIEEKRTFPSAREIETLQENVDLLQQESRNMDSRVSQLYMQLLHEIINKRDNSLEMQQLETSLLNRTAEYLVLKEDHEKLKNDHNALRLQLNNQLEEFQDLRQQIRKFSSVSEATFTPIQVETRGVLATSSSSSLSEENLSTKVRSDIISTRQTTTEFYSNCADIQRAGQTRSGIYRLKLNEYNKKMKVWCDFDQDPGGWIVIQRRTGRKNINFNRNMASYKRGFGKLRSDYWLGLENIHQLTNQSGVNFKLHIDMEDWSGKKTFVEYQSFRVGNESTGYRLNINHYSGTAGDSLTWHNNMKFTTIDHDDDEFGLNCARIHHAGWWFNSCAHSNLNGKYYSGGHYRNRYQDGIYWSEWRGGSYSLKSVSMKIRQTE